MTRRFVNQLRENEKVVEIYQILDRFLRPNKNGNLYLQFTFGDRTGTMEGRFWNATEELLTEFDAGDFCVLEGTVQRFQGNFQFITREITRCDPSRIKPSDFSRGDQIDRTALLARMKEMLRGITSPDLMNLADCFVTDEAFLAKFMERPAGVKLHHAYSGGLLEHTVQMMELALAVSKIYGKMLDQDMLLIGAFLHDVGKIEELSSQGGFSYTDCGQILGHPFLGTELLEGKITEAERLSGQPFDSETAMLLKHLILSHHGPLENGSTRVPMTLEALALHYIDSLDAKLAEFQRHIHEDPNSGSAWTNFIPSIERKLYKKQNSNQK